MMSTKCKVAPAAHRGIKITITVLLLLLLLSSSSFIQYSYAQETAATAEVVSDAENLDVVGGSSVDVTDLGDVVGDTMMDDSNAELSVDDLDTTAAGGEDAADKTEDTIAATTETTEKNEETSITEGESNVVDGTTEATDDTTTTTKDSETNATSKETGGGGVSEETPVVQAGPYIDLLGDTLLSLQMVDETHAQVNQHYTNEALSGKKVVGLYFSADWCGPCKQFTPDLVNFYNKINARRGKIDEFEIVWISRCRDVDSFGQYFTQMNWLALPPNEAMGTRGQYLGEKYKVQSIPTLVLLDEIGNVITTDGRNKIPLDKAGIGFPWRSPVSVLISALVPRSFRLLVKSQFSGLLSLVKGVLMGKKEKKDKLKGVLN